ncbi:PIN domain-containing protein [Bifidobacterium sp. ESL0732]|uniref:type II toxin-antitoxin system VapC family toxin n=1 Tax=Bifidobacterium sp. ESL0732 TaxID=2983222 RepID=UPI0023F7B75D|nr:PIN domain-containing protein [Bifidobacterium sp. ESL0732]WEV64525.1 PIN domain-containing protein [Bifidobacterium sp. ESL0732]
MKNKIFIDTNFLLDIMITDRPNSGAAFSFFKSIDGHHEPHVAVCAGSLKDAYYISRHDLSETKRRNWIRRFTDAFEILPIDKAVCKIAVDSDEPDFEDGIIRACAERWRADCIVSRDAKAFLNASIPKIGTDEFISNLETKPYRS